MGDKRLRWGSQLGGAATRWRRLCYQECTTCRGCGQQVMPLDAYCGDCGQADPAKVSLSAAVGVVIAVGLLAVTGTAAAVALS